MWAGLLRAAKNHPTLACTNRSMRGGHLSHLNHQMRFGELVLIRRSCKMISATKSGTTQHAQVRVIASFAASGRASIELCEGQGIHNGTCYETHWDTDDKDANMAASEGTFHGLHRRRTARPARIISNDVG